MINVLSLFDGISCCQLALNRIGIEYDSYFASEIDKNAITITQHNFSNTIQLGDVSKIKADELPKIHLLAGGSPCQGFSFMGKRLNLNDEKSKLFFEYLRLLRELKPDYFFLENVVMDKKCEEIISNELGVSAYFVNSSLVSAQNRPRLYWTNIPYIGFPKDQRIVVKDILQNNPDDSIVRIINYSEMNLIKKRPEHFIRSVNDKFPTLLAMNKGYSCFYIEQNDKIRKLSMIELERLQTVPDDYTSVITDLLHRQHTLGNGWTVDVIAWFFSFLPYHKKHTHEINRLRSDNIMISDFWSDEVPTTMKGETQ